MIRRATRADIPALLDLWSTARTAHAETPDTPELVAGVLSRSAVFVAEASEEALIGAVIAGWDGWRGYLYRLAVRPSRRRAGVASQLVAAAEAWLLEQGAPKLAALVAFEDADARAFWASVGYGSDEAVGRMLRHLD